MKRKIAAVLALVLMFGLSSNVLAAGRVQYIEVAPVVSAYTRLSMTTTASRDLAETSEIAHMRVIDGEFRNPCCCRWNPNPEPIVKSLDVDSSVRNTATELISTRVTAAEPITSTRNTVTETATITSTVFDNRTVGSFADTSQAQGIGREVLVTFSR